MQPVIDFEKIEDEILLRRKLELQRRRLTLVKSHGLLFYRPHPKQDTFHRAGKFRLRMLRAGNRTGKSTMGCAEDCAWLMGERVWYPKDDPARTSGIPQRPVKGLVITTDWDKVDEIWTSEKGDRPGKLWQFLPSDFVKSKRRNHAGAVETIETNNGGLLRFDTVESFKKNPQGSESSDWDFIHIDEPCPEDQWKAAARGLMDRNGSAWFTLTPLKEFWINDLFFPGMGLARAADVWATTATTRENPHLTEEAIAAYEATLNDDEKQCRLLGIPLELSGLVYKEFNYAAHVLQELPLGWEAWDQPPYDYTIYVAIDPHPQTPHAVMFIAVSPLGQAFVYDEIFIHCGVNELADLINSKLIGRSLGLIKCDPIAWIFDPITEMCMAEHLMQAGVFVMKSSKAKEFGILNMKSVLRKPGRVYFCPTVRRTIWEISRYCYDKENRPIDKDDHMMENMYRLFINEMVWISPAPYAPVVQEVVIGVPEFGGA